MTSEDVLYRNNLKNREFGKEAPQNFDAERATIAEGQGASEHQNSEAKPTEPKPDSSGCFGIHTLFSKEGPFAEFSSDFEQRKEQLDMAQQVLQAYHNNHIALIEAGTGTGKSLAYLVVAALWALKTKEKTVVSTHTIALQEQLIRKDIPFLFKALDLEMKAVLVKGMNNYLCLRKLEEAENAVEDRLLLWAKKTEEGSRSDLSFPLRAEEWEKVAAEQSTCTHVKCPRYKECFFFKARKEASDAQILIVNHHLLLSDLVRKISEKESSVLPPFERLVLDEAHHLEEIALDVLSARVDKLSLLAHLKELNAETATGTFARLLQALLRGKVRDSSLIERLKIDLPAHKNGVVSCLESAFAPFGFSLQERKWRLKEEEVSTLKPSFEPFLEELKSFVQSLLALIQDIEPFEEKIPPLLTVELKSAAEKLEKSVATLESFFSVGKGAEHVRWIEVKHSVTLVDARLDVSTVLKEKLFGSLSTVSLCSATLATGGNFQFVKKRLGIEKIACTEQIVTSPFDFQKRTLFAMPTDLPNPDDPAFLSSANHAICEILKASGGSAFVLFTSYEMLRASYAEVSKLLEKEKYPFLKQGDLSRALLLQTFKAKPGSVLFGTDSFWEGIDVAGEALRCVILVKLPFRVPTDPLMEAQKEWMQIKGEDPFFDYAVPQAIVKFKQGFGRLMRKKTDRGCVICLDRRLHTKSYGKLFLNSLPPCQKIQGTQGHLLEQIRKFYIQTPLDLLHN